jgi:hypothetical protein
MLVVGEDRIEARSHLEIGPPPLGMIDPEDSHHGSGQRDANHQRFSGRVIGHWPDGGWEIDDWGDPGGVAARVVVTITQLARGRVEIALDDTATVWIHGAGARTAYGVMPKLRALPSLRRGRRPRHAPAPWPTRAAVRRNGG